MHKCIVVLFVVSNLVAQSTFSPCDIDHNGIVNVVDVQLIVDQVLGLAPCTSQTVDGQCDVAAVQRVINAALGGSCLTSSPDVTQGLVAYWKMDESSGAIVHDSSGFGFNGTVEAGAGNYAWNPNGGRINGAIQFYATDAADGGSITVPSNSMINFDGDFSITLWLKTAGGSLQYLVWKTANILPLKAIAFQGYGLGTNGNSPVAYLDGNSYTSPNQNIPLNQWVHIAMVKLSGQLTFYINGTLDSTFTVPAGITPTPNPVLLGGTLDDVRLYDRALSSSEVQTITQSNGSYVGPPQTAPPAITSFTANPSPINAGQSTTLSWAVSGTTSVSIDSGLGLQPSQGTINVTPAATTTYTLTATNTGGAVTALATAVVNQPSSPASPDIVITSPAANTVISGTVNLAASVTGLPNVAGVEYFYAGRPLYAAPDPVGLLPAPYVYAWNSNYEWDSYGQFVAKAVDASGNVLATSSPVPVQIANGTYTMQQTFPVPGQSASGIIHWTEALNTEPAGASINCFVDGVQVAQAGLSFSYDSTQLPNGFHDFHCVELPSGSGAPLAMSSQQIYVDNGQTPMQLRATFRTLYLTPGQSEVLASRMVYTNGVESPVTASYAVDNSAVANVDSQSGTITALSSGVANVSVTANGKSDSVLVIVNSSPGFPHFTNTGKIVTSYVPGSSLFVKSIFQGPGWADFKNDPSLVADVKAAAVNTLESGVEVDNPADDSGWNPNNFSNQAGTYAGWVSYFNAINAFEMNYVVPNNWSVLLTGDELDRSVVEMEDSIFDPYSTPKIQYALSYWQTFGHVIGMEMVDEADGAWGCNPLDTTPGYWTTWSSEFTSSPFAALLSIIDAVPHPNLAWPTIGMGSPTCFANWQGNPSFADYDDVYWDNGLPFYQDGESLYESSMNAYDRKLAGVLPVMQRNKPFLSEVGFAGPAYDKDVTGSTYVPGLDKWDRSGATPQSVSAQVFMAIARGSAGVRLFSWASASGLNTVYNAGTQYVFNGSSPYYAPARWNAMSAAFNLEQTLEPYVLAPMAPAIDLGPYVETGAKSGTAGNMLIAINDLDSVQTITATLTPYVTGSSVTRYRLWGSQQSTQSLGIVSSDQITLNPGEVLIYVFPAI